MTKIFLVFYETMGIPEYDESGTYIIGYNDIKKGHYFTTEEEYFSNEPDAEVIRTQKVVAEFTRFEIDNLQEQLNYFLNTHPVS